MRVRGESMVDPIDSRSIIAVVLELVQCCRELQFDDGVLLAGPGHERREGLRVLQGEHPNVGTRYRVVIVEPIAPELTAEERTELAKVVQGRSDKDAAVAEWVRRRDADLERSGQMGTKETSVTIGLLADDSQELRIGVSTAHRRELNFDVRLDRPRSPRSLSVSLDGRIGGNWPFRGRLVGNGALSVDQLPPAESSTPQLRVELRHPRMKGAATIAVRNTDEAKWRIAVSARGRVRGILRPIGAIASPWVASVARRRLRVLLAELPGRVEAFNRDWRAQIARDGPHGVAQQWLDEFVAALPASLVVSVDNEEA